MTLAMCLVAATCFAGSGQMGKKMGSTMSAKPRPEIGTWKLNEAKSKVLPGTTKNSTVVYEVDGDNMKVTVDGTDAKGMATHSVWIGKFDGKDYPVTGDSSSDMRAYRVLGPRTLELTNKKDGKVSATGRAVVSADGKTRTVTLSARDSKGMMKKNVMIYDKASDGMGKM